MATEGNNKAGLHRRIAKNTTSEKLDDELDNLVHKTQNNSKAANPTHAIHNNNNNNNNNAKGSFASLVASQFNLIESEDERGNPASNPFIHYFIDLRF